MKIDGHCHCGRISFHAEVDPEPVTICHCTDCQTLTGSAFRANISAPAVHFVLRSGTPKSYVKTAESGNKRRHAFCGDCGTPIYACAVIRLPGSTSSCPGSASDPKSRRCRLTIPYHAFAGWLMAVVIAISAEGSTRCRSYSHSRCRRMHGRRHNWRCGGGHELNRHGQRWAHRSPSRHS